MAKMFYTGDEVKTMLGLDDEGLRALVQQGKLRELLDGSRRVFKADQVEALSAQAPKRRPPSETDASGFALEMADSGSGAGKADTALGAEASRGLEQGPGLADTDTVAKGSLAPSESGSGEGILQLDGSGSGSGLLDLTREGDDTSLGAVLDEIYPGEEDTAAGAAGLGSGVAAGMGTGLASALGTGLAEAQGVEVAAAIQPIQVGPAKTAGSLIAGMILAVVLLGLAFSALAAVLLGVTPVYLTILSDNLLYFLIGSLVLAVLIFVLGAVLGKRRA